MDSSADHDCKKLEQEIERGLRMAKSAGITRTLIASRASVALVDGALVSFPVSGGISVPVGTVYTSLIVSVVLSDADKLSTGKTLELNSYYSSNGGASWNFINGTLWNSYGAGGLTVTDPDGLVRINPDPALGVPLGSVKGNIVRLQYLAHGLANAGVAVYGTN